MYRHILIPTDGSDLAERAVTHGLSLAKFVGAKVTVIIVEERLGGWLYTEQIKEHTASVLDRAANAAKQAGVPCDTIHVQMLLLEFRLDHRDALLAIGLSAMAAVALIITAA